MKYVVSQVAKYPHEMTDEEFQMALAAHQQFPTSVTSCARIPRDLFEEFGRRAIMNSFDPSI